MCSTRRRTLATTPTSNCHGDLVRRATVAIDEEKVYNFLPRIKFLFFHNSLAEEKHDLTELGKTGGQRNELTFTKMALKRFSLIFTLHTDKDIGTWAFFFKRGNKALWLDQHGQTNKQSPLLSSRHFHCNRDLSHSCFEDPLQLYHSLELKYRGNGLDCAYFVGGDRRWGCWWRVNVRWANRAIIASRPASQSQNTRRSGLANLSTHLSIYC